ncbi:L,D-transpeptidase family protein [Scytonema sp. UIC 10036]|uniref:L,D-transpeptidase n=1 Tax=Scytonema sp. UIC 10036 TaxID=2304196 RepID=UPI0012DA3DAA|nr:L,D-transpeptidase [Scytonema sp. UIC 10036]MUG92286.1 L,D-transpeptidase family protein [Scytonema sp. UIC 10036]
MLKKILKIACFVAIILVKYSLINIIFQPQKSNAAHIYAYNFEKFKATKSVYYDPSITKENNQCLNGLLNQLPQQGDKKTTEACLNTFGYNPEKKIKSPVMFVFEIGKTSQDVTTTLIYKSKNGQIHQEKFKAVGSRYYEWHIKSGIYTLDYIKPDRSPAFKPAYGNFYSPEGEKDKNGNPVNIGFHGREGNLMAGNGSNGCYRHRVEDMKRIMTIVKNAGEDANLPHNWYESTLPIAVISRLHLDK